jgi:RNA polymerase sigma-70 factor (ECF subfamily)
MAHDSDRLLVARVRRGEPDAWQELIARFEGRLLAFVEKRIGRGHQSEDIVQETFVGFLTSLPNYDESRLLEGYLFSIAAHKLTDYLRREGRRPTVPLAGGSDSGGSWDVAGNARGASSIHRSREDRRLEERTLVRALTEQFEHLQTRGDWEKIQCAELLFVRGWPNKEVAKRLAISEQKVANHKFDFLARLRTAVEKLGLSQDVLAEAGAAG